MTDIERLKGTGVAVITPFDQKGEVDFQSLDGIVRRLVNGGIDYLVALGTTAETSTLSASEKKAVLDQIIKSAEGKLPIVLGIGSNNTSQVLNDLELYDEDEVVAILSVSPYYNRPSQDGIHQHFSAIADKSRKPIILYNVPGRTGSNMEADTILKLAKHKNIIGIKDATDDLSQINKVIMNRPDDFLVISGEDSQTFYTMCLGGDGVISVIGNLLPKSVCDLVKLTKKGDLQKAREVNQYLTPFFSLITKEGNPTSIKAGLASQNLCTTQVRLPLVKATQGLQSEFKELL